MSSPVLHLLVGPNGAGKTTFVDRVLRPGTHLPFVNADLIAADLWPGAELEHAYAAARLADEHRRRLLNAGASFITETVFSHPSKAELVDEAVARNYQVTLHVILVPLELTLRRVAHRVAHGGHQVPEEKVRARYARLWSHVATASRAADRTRYYDNSTAAEPFRLVATLEHGIGRSAAQWPTWTPAVLRDK